MLFLLVACFTVTRAVVPTRQSQILGCHKSLVLIHPTRRSLKMVLFRRKKDSSFPQGSTENTRIMNMLDAKAELESMGYRTMFEQNGLVASMSKFRWEVTALVDTLVFVEDVQTLDCDDIKTRLEALPKLVHHHTEARWWPPIGFFRTTDTLLVFYSQSPISPDTASYIAQWKRWSICDVTLIAAQDSSGVSYRLSKQSIPTFNYMQYPKLLYLSAILTGFHEGKCPSQSKWVKLQFFLIMSIVILPCIFVDFNIAIASLYQAHVFLFSTCAMIQYFRLVWCRRRFGYNT